MGHNDWIKYGWGDDLHNTWQRGDSLVIDFTNGNEPFEKLSPLDAAIDAVNKIVATHPAPYTLMCSGGVDSQAMMWAWLKSGHPFNVVSIKYVSNGTWFNDHDLDTLVQFTEKNNIPVTYYEFDIIDFLENGELQKISVANDCQSPQICTYIKMSELVTKGTILFSGNYIDTNMAFLNYTILGLHRYAKSLSTTDRRLIPFFFMYTPELAYSFTNMMPSWIASKDAYQVNDFHIVSPEIKFSGFEKVKDYYDKYRNRISLQLKKRSMHRASKRVFDLLFRYGIENTKSSQNIAVVINKTI